MVPDLGVDGVGEVDGGRARRERDHLPLRGEHVDLVLVEVELQGLEEFERVDRVGLPVHDPLEPCHLGRGRRAAVRRLGLVPPVGGDAVLGPAVHLLGPDLHLDRLSLQAHHRRVKRLVEVELRAVYVVLETALNGAPDRVDGPERRPAVLLGADDDTDPDEVVDVGELLAPHDHLLVDAPVVLRTAGHLGADAGAREPVAHGDQHPRQVLVALGVAHRDHLLDLRVLLRVQGREREVLELPLEILDAEPVSQRRVDVEGLLRGPALLPLGHHGDRPHVVETVGELDHEDAPVARHRDEHLADGGGLLGLLRVELEPVELGDTVDDRRHLGPEALLDLVERQARVLDGVVEDGRGDRPRVEAQVSDDARDCKRMGDVGLPRAPHLAAVDLVGEVAGTHHQVATLVVEACGTRLEPLDDSRQQRLEPRRPAGRGGRALEGYHPFKVPAVGPGQGRCPSSRTARRTTGPLSAALPPLPLPFRGRGGGRLFADAPCGRPPPVLEVPVPERACPPVAGAPPFVATASVAPAPSPAARSAVCSTGLATARLAAGWAAARTGSCSRADGAGLLLGRLAVSAPRLVTSAAPDMAAAAAGVSRPDARVAVRELQADVRSSGARALSAARGSARR